jgi:hypothetical protein
VNRTWVWLVVSPVLAGGVLTGHWLAYRLTSTPTDPFHAYLEHAPQVLLLLAGAAVILTAFGARLNAPPVKAFPLVGLATFVFQEHVERLAHGGGVPMLLTSPAFVVGLALQIPVALLAWALARWLLGLVADGVLRAPVCPDWAFLRVTIPIGALDPIDIRIPPGRGPPSLLRSR